MVIPYGRAGDGPDSALAERQRYGIGSPTVTAEVGKVLDHFPARVAIDQDGRARFRLEGGFGEMPVLIEGFKDYVPPRLEQIRDIGEWEAVVMEAVAGGINPIGHLAASTDLCSSFKPMAHQSNYGSAT